MTSTDDVGGDQAAVQALDPVQDGVGDGDGVRAGALGDGERHRGHPRRGVPSASATVETSASPLSVAKTDVGDVADIDRPAVAAW